MTPEQLAQRRLYATAALQGLAADPRPIPARELREALGIDLASSDPLTVWSQWAAHRAWLVADAMMAHETALPAELVTSTSLVWTFPAGKEVDLGPAQRALAKLVDQYGGTLTEVSPK